MENKKGLKEALLVSLLAAISCLIGAGVVMLVDKDVPREYFEGGYKAGYTQAIKDYETGSEQVKVTMSELGL